MKKRFLKCVSLAVTIATVMGSTMFGTVAVADNTPQAIDVQSNANTNENATIVVEAESLRSEYEKHFFMSDGSFTVVSYNEPVHKKVDGQWVEVNNTLTPKADTDGTTRYETVDGIAHVSFAGQFDSELVTVSQDDYAVTWGITAVPSNPNTIQTTAMPPSSAAIVPQDVSHLSQEEQKVLAELSTSVIRYVDSLAPDVDLEYTVLPNRVKESIILQSPQNISAYVLNLYTQNLSARLLESREIEFYNAAGEAIFTMWAPYMYDSDGAVSQNVAVELAAVRPGQYLVRITPDAHWLEDANRAYPIVIDPDITVNLAHTNIIDNYVWESYGVQNNNSSLLFMGNYGGHPARVFLRYAALPTLPANTTIESATQTFYLNTGTTTASAASAYRVTGGMWQSGTVCWDNMPAADTLIASNISHNNCSYYAFDCTEAVQSWYENGGANNYGIMLRYTDETVNDHNALFSADYALESKRPVLSIRYTNVMDPVDPDDPPDIFWPTPNYHNVSSKWGYRYFKGEVHRGIDIGCGQSTFYAAISGTACISYDYRVGNIVDVRHSDTTFRVRYYHVTDNSYLVDTGQYVTAGTPLALSGNTGFGNMDPHLHFLLQWGSDINKVYNPLETFNSDDDRRNLINPNPMFILVDGIYVPNADFDYTYVHNIYNCIYYRNCSVHDWIT